MPVYVPRSKNISMREACCRNQIAGPVCAVGAWQAARACWPQHGARPRNDHSAGQLAPHLYVHTHQDVLHLHLASTALAAEPQPCARGLLRNLMMACATLSYAELPSFESPAPSRILLGEIEKFERGDIEKFIVIQDIAKI